MGLLQCLFRFLALLACCRTCSARIALWLFVGLLCVAPYSFGCGIYIYIYMVFRRQHNKPNAYLTSTSSPLCSSKPLPLRFTHICVVLDQECICADVALPKEEENKEPSNVLSKREVLQRENIFIYVIYYVKLERHNASELCMTDRSVYILYSCL